MLLIPAIDIKNGRCVRLRQGDLENNITVYSDDPVAVARQWADLGADRLHIVDLDGAATGRPVNAALIRDMVNEVSGDMEVELGGGLRSLEQVERYIDAGVSYAVIGTAALKRPGFLHEACSNFGGQIIVALDARDGLVATDGWQNTTAIKAVDIARKFESYGVEAFLYTDIARDGMLTGCNVEATAELARAVSVPVIASGGVRDLDDIRRLLAVEEDGVCGAILGRSLYEGTLRFEDALALVEAAQ
ncbi:MAG: 1-(5-phosphoribosyl)-5-[(5-phosphoribosylamino)methylideneamino]imidazole-4-carboxamide isomerase [Sutterella sp.]|nr:1-(5-phosphoribosyl)-5-[(5-phosphoribosylamino)methylideneamino]imidazole-4-carboxamide isomerase [Sutterella sp.]